MKHISKLIKSLILLSLSTTTIFAANIPASSTPPGNLDMDEVPVFVTIGWDDNTSAAGLTWASSLYTDKKNPDGTNYISSFYFNSQYFKDEAALVTGLNTLIASGHEIGNHTYNHQDDAAYALDPNGPGSDDGWNKMIKFLRYEATLAEWKDIVQKGLDTIVDYTNSIATDIKGFRSPYLEYGTNLFPALAALGYRYDCSIETNSDGDGTWIWPYTMDNGSPSHDNSWKNNPGNQDIVIDGTHYDGFFTVNAQPGLWELPTYSLLIPTDAQCPAYNIPTGLRDRIRAKVSWMTEADVHVTGFDYNLWSEIELSAVEVLGMLKFNLDQRIENNRAPFLFGAHTQFYVGTWAAENAPNATREEMQACIEDFMAYATSKPEVRITSMNSIIDWMEHPTPLSTAPEDSTTPGDTEYIEILDLAGWEIGQDTIGSTGTFHYDSSISTSASLNLAPNDTVIPGDEESIDWAYVSLNAYLDTTFDSVTAIEVTYSSDQIINLGLSSDTYGYTYELAPGQDVTIKVSISSFTFSWGSLLSGEEPLVMSDMSGVGLEATVEGTTNLSITSMKLYGFVPKSATPITLTPQVQVKQEIQILGVQSGALQLAIPTAGRYNIALYSLGGQVLARYTQELSAGNTTINLNHSFAPGLVLVQIQGISGQAFDKVMIR